MYDEGSKLKSIGKNAFFLCVHLENITLPEGLETICASAFRASGLVSITMPDSLKTIYQGAFYQCKSLERVTLNEGLKNASAYDSSDKDDKYYGSFEESAIRSIKIPSTLKEIEPSMF